MRRDSSCCSNNTKIRLTHPRKTIAITSNGNQKWWTVPYHATRTFFPALVLTVEEKEVELDMKT
jgi:hypothetical protein